MHTASFSGHHGGGDVCWTVSALEVFAQGACLPCMWCLSGGMSPPGVSIQGGVCTGGCLPSGGVCPGVCVQGVYTRMDPDTDTPIACWDTPTPCPLHAEIHIPLPIGCWDTHPTPCEQNDSLTGVKTLNSRNFVRGR